MRISIEEKHSLVARYQAGESVSDICADSGVPKSTFYTWIKPYTVTMTDSGHAVSQQAFIKMKQKLQKLEKKIEILQKVNCTVSASLQEKLQELAKLHGQYSQPAFACSSSCPFRRIVSSGKPQRKRRRNRRPFPYGLLLIGSARFAPTGGCAWYQWLCCHGSGQTASSGIGPGL